MALEKVAAVFLATSILQLLLVTGQSGQNQAAEEFLRNNNRTASEYSRRDTVVFWKQVTGKVFDDEKELLKKPQIVWKEFMLNQAVLARKFARTSHLGAVKRRLLKIIGISSAYPKSAVLRRLHQWLSREFYHILLRGRVHMADGRVLASKRAIIDFFAKSRDYGALAEVWRKWRDATGKRMRRLFRHRVRTLNAGARENGYSDYGFYEYFSNYADSNLPARVTSLMSEVRPLFLELHAFVRWKLSQRYPGRFNKRGPIPAHLLGNPWALTWVHLLPLVRPYPNFGGDLDVTAALHRQNWTVLRMVKTAERFFTSLGLPPMTSKFWERSAFLRPRNASNYDCQGTAWDFTVPDDFRIKMCARPNFQYLNTIHHEMGHIQYFMAYAHLPYSFRNGANSAFHEAIGDTISLSVLTPQHLQKLGLMDKTPIDERVELNCLMRDALYKVAFLPYALSVDMWRWSVFNGRFPEWRWNKEWWHLRRDLQGLEAPVRRSEADLDPAAKYHVAINLPYIRYFLSTLMQFQFFEATCAASGHVGPMHRCDIYGSKGAGQLLKKMMALGRSKPWPFAMGVMTGQRQVRAGPLKRYFAPLHAWLKKNREAQGYPIGW